MNGAPFDDPVGAFILEQVSQESWDEWIEIALKSLMS